MRVELKRYLLATGVFAVSVGLLGGYAFHLRSVGAQQTPATLVLQQDGPTYPNAKVPAAVAPVYNGVTPLIGSTAFPGLSIVGGAVTAGCSTGTITMPSALPAGSYAIDVIQVGNQATGDRFIVPSATLSADLTTVTVNRCNLQAVSLTGTSAIAYLVRIYKAS